VENAAPPAPSAEAVQLSNRLATALPKERTDMIDKLRDGKGGVNTEALALSIAALSGAARAEARAALADRLTRMSEATLAEKLHDASAEVRRGACLACAMKESKSFIPELVRLLEDREALVVRAAHAALVSLTGEDLGPSASDDAAERKRALERWKDKWSPANK
jgi:hypothetical protein